MREPVTAYIGLGANLGEPAAALALAVQQLGSHPGVTVTAQSSFYRTAPLDSSGPDYTNAVVEVCTTLTAPELLACIQSIEAAAGRERPFRNAPRTLDLDILLYGDARVESSTLSIPHPRMWQRAFVLLPLAEIAPQCVSGAQLRAVEAQAISKIETSQR
ncbi:MAG: 2-amino-4-hydroxy-6-hydroxymethyldihydropteridine diphosphokinase [Pseudomonadota bacterium]